MAKRSAWSMLKTALKGFSKDDLMVLSAALAFYAILSLAPLLILLVTVTGWLGEGTQQKVIQQVASSVGPQAGQAIKAIITQAKNKQAAASLSAGLSLAATVLAAVGGLIQLQTSLNRIFNVRVSRGFIFTWLWKRFLSLLLILAIGVILIASVIATSLISTVLPRGALGQVVNVVPTLIVFTGVFMAMYKLLPDVQLTWTDTLVGGICTAILFMAGNYGIGEYLSRTGNSSVYGAAGSLFILLVWLYYSSIIVLFSAELTYAYTLHYGHAPPPDKKAERIEQPTPAPQHQQQT